ncbi:putative retrotransposon protein [Tanacetum coccineum]|uniref:Retrotransposon protein n=1 Tax=Tanacetum coccineum TaxID=301880 RepID=A0ABQ4YNQ6_9ASTR
MEVLINGLPRSIKGNVTALKTQTLEEAINIAQRLMDQIIKHDSVQEANDRKRKLEDNGHNIITTTIRIIITIATITSLLYVQNGGVNNCYASQSGRVQKNKPQGKAKGKEKGKGLKNSYPTKPKKPQPYKKERPAKDGQCHHCKEEGHWKRNCPLYLAELMKKKKTGGQNVASTSSDNFYYAPSITRGVVSVLSLVSYEIDMRDQHLNQSLFNAEVSKRAGGGHRQRAKRARAKTGTGSNGHGLKRARAQTGRGQAKTGKLRFHPFF